ncbi:MAG TPA: glycosyltransferase [Bacteroidales bacterium]|jgi:glycosyltransferase involved in cell wall biosynthesis|nr:glycosyltransferase [Bacteroidales bacterium]
MGSIIIFSKKLVKGGAEKQALMLAKLLTGKNLNVVIIVWDREKIDHAHLDFINNNSLKYFGLKGNPLRKFIRFNRILKKEDAFLILAYLTLANFLSGVIRIFNKHIYTVGGIRTEKLPFLKFIVEKFVHNKLNNATIFNNYSARNKFETRGFIPEKIFVIHNAISIPTYERQSWNSGEITIITVARYVDAKDFKTSLLAFAKLTEDHNDSKIRYLLIGYGPLESSIRSLIRSYNLVDKVKLIINPPNVNDYYQNADIYLSTSLYEGLSNSLMEAMVAGLPIIATDVGDNSFLVKDGYNGYIVDIRDVTAIAMKLELLVRSEELRKRFGLNSRTLIKDEFSEDKLLINYLEIIKRYTNLNPNTHI